MRSKDLLKSSILTHLRHLILMRTSIQILRGVLNGPRKTSKPRSKSQSTTETPSGTQTRRGVTTMLKKMRSHLIEALSIL